MQKLAKLTTNDRSPILSAEQVRKHNSKPMQVNVKRWFKFVPKEGGCKGCIGHVSLTKCKEMPDCTDVNVTGYEGEGIFVVNV